MSNICIINSGQDKAIQKYGVATYSLLRPVNSLTKLVRSFAVRIKREYIRYFYKDHWLDELAPYDTLIVFDGMDTVGVCRNIYEKYPDKRLVLFYWNPIKKDILGDIPGAFELWTFDYDDAQKYGMRYNGQFVFEKELELKNFDTAYDLYFVGQNKGRFRYLERLKKEIEDKTKLSVRYRLVSPIKALFSDKYSKRIPYKQVLEETEKSRCVLEYNQKEQKGLTQRAIESLFLQKKLITNNSEISRKDFFNKKNIYILGDSMDGLDLFMSESLEPYPQSVVERYYFSNWLKRIESSQELNDTK